MTIADDDEGLELYFESIRKIPLVSRQEESILAGKIAKGDKAALNRLVEGNLRLVVRIAKSMWTPPYSLLDLIQDGNIGLVKAAERFDATQNVKFSTYAVWWIRQSISRSMVNTGRQIRLPHRRKTRCDGSTPSRYARASKYPELLRKKNSRRRWAAPRPKSPPFCIWETSPWRWNRGEKMNSQSSMCTRTGATAQIAR